jgi:metallo-beta-lactamase class B
MSLPLTLALSAAMLAPQANADWTQPIEPFQVADDLYWVGSADLGSYLFTSEDGHILLDVPLEANVGMIVDNIRRLGFEPTDVEVLIASHSHFDHVGGLALMRAITGARVILSGPDAEIVARGGAGPTAAGAYAPIHADLVIEHRGTVQLGGWTLTAQVTPGHTPGCTSWSGDATIEGAPVSFAFVCSLSVLGGYRLIGRDQTFPGMGAAYCNSLATLRALTPDLFLAPHAGFIDLDEKLPRLRAGDRRAFVDPEGYRAYLDAAAENIEDTLREQGHMGGCATLVERPGG